MNKLLLSLGFGAAMALTLPALADSIEDRAQGEICQAIQSQYGSSLISLSDCLNQASVDLSIDGCPLDLPAQDPTVGPGQPFGDGTWTRCKQLEGERAGKPVDFQLSLDVGLPTHAQCSGQIAASGAVDVRCQALRHD